MTIDVLADSIWRNLSQPSDSSMSVIAFWLRTNIGLLNSLIQTSYALDDNDYEIVPEIGIDESVIFEKLYLLNYYSKQIRNNLGANGVDIVQEVNEFGASVKMINKNEVAKTYQSLRKDTKIELDDLVNAYLKNRATPQAIHGDDTYSADGTIQDQYNRTRGLF